MHGKSEAKTNIILASASPRRQQLLREMGCEFHVETASVPELHTEDLTARELALVNAYRKARVIAKSNPDYLVIGADTLVFLGSRLFGKPESRAEAIRMIGELQGVTHQVVTGVCLLHLRTHRQVSFAQTTSVTFRPLDRAAIEHYLGKIDPFDKAGAYAIQESGDLIVERIEGSYTNVVGFPMERIREVLARW